MSTHTPTGFNWAESIQPFADRRDRARTVTAFAGYLAENVHGNSDRALEAMASLAEWCDDDPELLEQARGFYTDYLGLNVEGCNLGWVAQYRSPDGRAYVQLVTRDATSPQDSVISVHVGLDIDEAYAEAQHRGYEIVHPLTDEPWGVRRFFVRAPDGNVINIVSHRDE